MKEACLHLPVDFEMRSDVRKLAMGCARQSGDGLKRLAALFLVRLWTDWAREGLDWRPLEGAAADPAAVAWAKEPIAFLLEDACGWPGECGERGTLIRLCIEAGVLGVEARGNLLGLVLKDFWRYNAHLAPEFRTIQSKGGEAKAEKRRQRQVEEMAGQQTRLLQAQMVFPEAAKVTAEEQRAAVGLVMRIDRAGGAAVRGTLEYSPTMLECAVDVVRRHGREAVTAVERYIHAHRDDAGVVKTAERVVERFDEYLAKA